MVFNKRRLKIGVMIVLVTLIAVLFIVYCVGYNGSVFSIPDYSMEYISYYISEDEQNESDERIIIRVRDFGREIEQYLPYGRILYIKDWTTWKAYCGKNEKGDVVVYDYNVDIRFSEKDVVITHTDKGTGEQLYKQRFEKYTITREEMNEHFATPYKDYLVDGSVVS